MVRGPHARYTAVFVAVAALTGWLTPAATWAQGKLDEARLAADVVALRADVDELKKSAAQGATVAASLQEIDQRLSVLAQDVAKLGQARDASPDVAAELDGLDDRVTRLQEDVAGLRAAVAAGERPAAGGGGGIAYDRGFALVTPDGRFSLKLGGYGQFRSQLAVATGFDEVNDSTLRLRRARLGMSGHLGSKDLAYKVVFETIASTPALDYHLDYTFFSALILRAGQYKTQFTRSFITSSNKLAFPERVRVVENLRYDRDIQVGLLGRLAGARLAYYVGLGNGAGKNKVNDNIDYAATLRVEAGVLGAVFTPSEGDVEGSTEPRLVVGAALIHDLVAMPKTITGVNDAAGEAIALNTDVDGNGKTDNVRVISGGIDAVFRYRGVELVAEWILRHERWGSILDLNPELAAALDVIGGGGPNRSYQGFYGQATYMVLPRQLMVGARVGHARQTLLGVGGDGSAVPKDSRLFEIDGLAQLYGERFGGRALGLQVSYFDTNAKDGTDAAGDKEIRLILETQVVF
jgi:hypothetical protein